MKFNVDEAVGKFFPWELELTIEGKDYKTRAITTEERFRLGKGKELGEDEAMKLLNGLFCGEAPKIEAMGADEITGMLSAILHYSEARAVKNSLGVRATVAKAMDVQLSSGNSSRR